MADRFQGIKHAYTPNRHALKIGITFFVDMKLKIAYRHNIRKVAFVILYNQRNIFKFAVVGLQIINKIVETLDILIESFLLRIHDKNKALIIL
jgi:hypothetical protein